MFEFVFWALAGIAVDRFFPGPVTAVLNRVKGLWAKVQGPKPDA